MTRDDLIVAVALRMDEITASNDYSVTIDGADGNPLYMLIKGVLDEAMMEIYATAPYWRLPTTAFAAGDIEITTIPADDQRKMIRVKVPDGFLRIAEISCDYFHRPISEIYPKQSTEGKRQYNKHLRAGVAKPVGVMSSGLWSGTSSRQIECYSVPYTATTAVAANVEASYIAKPASVTPETNTTVVVPTALEPALEWLAASKAFGARGDTNHMAVCLQNAQNLLV